MAIADIEALVKESAQDPSKRLAQHRLAHEVLSLVHSEADAATAQEQHAAFFNRRTSPPASTEPLPVSHPPNPRLTTVPANAPPDVSSQLNKYAPITTAFNSPSMHITLPSSLVVSQPIARILYSAGLVASRSEGHRLCAQQGAYAGSRPGDSGTMGDDLEYTPCKNWEPSETNRFIIDNQLLILRVGKWKVKIIKIVSDEEFEAQGLTCPGWKEEISNEEREHLERQERDTNKQSSKDSRAKRLDRAFSRLLHDRKEERGGQWTMSTGKEVDNTDVRGLWGAM